RTPDVAPADVGRHGAAATPRRAGAAVSFAARRAEPKGPVSLTAGTRLGPYVIEAPLGAGGMGEVYRARDSRLERHVAVKLLRAGALGDADRRERFQQEATATSALSHPNILTVYDFGDHAGAPFIVAELLEGEELRALLDGGPIPPRR